MATKRQDVVPVPGSEREPVAGARRVGDANPDERATVTIVLRPKSSSSSATSQRRRTTSGMTASRGADPADVARVRRFAQDYGLTVAQENLAARSVSLTGTVAQLAAAFRVDLGRFASDEGSYRGRTGPVYVPANLAGAVRAVLGLDDRPQARAHFRIQPQLAGATTQASAAGAAFTPDQLGRLYDFPSGLQGAGQTVAIIELGGGYKTADLTTYFRGLGLPRPKVTAVSVDGAKNAPVGNPTSADGEVLLDIEVVGALAPKAKIVVYFAPNTTAGFYNGIAAAVHAAAGAPSAISISWGQAESGWTAQAMDAYDQLFADAATLGITVTAAAGDDGSTDRVTDGQAHVDFPASSPNVLACGGTSLTASASAIVSEIVWNDGPNAGATGGGVSEHFPLASYQASATVPPSANRSHFKGRGVPDVAGDADPQTGYRVRVDGHDLVFGGTSAVAPLWAALVAIADQQLGHRAGLLQPRLYRSGGATAFRDIVSGNNGAYSASPGWDACTGWGSPRGQALVATLAAS